MSNLQAELLKFRLQLGFSTREFAKAIGVSPSMVGQVENGEVQDVRAYVEKLQKKYGRDPKFLHTLGICPTCQGSGIVPPRTLNQKAILEVKISDRQTKRPDNGHKRAKPTQTALKRTFHQR